MTFDKACPLGFAERQVDSQIVSKARYGKTQTAKVIAANIGLHRGSAVANSLDMLKSHGLAENSKVGWCALPPSENTANWFVQKGKCKSPEWYDQFAYFPIAFPKREKLSTRCAVVYWFLVARSNLRRSQNITGIANCLSIGWATADRAVKQLLELVLLTISFGPPTTMLPRVVKRTPGGSQFHADLHSVKNSQFEIATAARYHVFRRQFCQAIFSQTSFRRSTFVRHCFWTARAKLMALAIRFDRLIAGGGVADQAVLARLGCVSRARVTQILNLLNLAPDMQEELLFQPPVEWRRDPLTERDLRLIVSEPDWHKQRWMWKRLL